MSGQWTPTNPGAGSPADIRADAARRQTQASETRTAAGQVAAAAHTGTGWQGASADALAQKTGVYRTELEIIASQSDAHAAALQRYAGEVESIQQQQNTITANQQSVASQLRSARRRLNDVTDSLQVDPTSSPALSYQLQNSVDTLTGQANGLSSQLAALAQQRSGADNTAIMGLTGAESRGGLASILAASGPASPLSTASPFLRDITLEQLAELSEVELTMLFTLHPQLASQLASSASPEHVATWWGGLSVDQQSALVVGASTLIGSLGGIAPMSRVAANRINAVHRSEWISSRLADLEGRAPSGGFSTPRVDYQDEIAKLQAEQTYLQNVIDGRAQLYLYDPASQSIIQMIGTPGPSTDSVVTYVPGTFTSVNSFFDGGVQQVGQWLKSSDPNTVSFVWKQGAFPGENPTTGSMDLTRILEANDEAWALGAGEQLAGFQNEMAASSVPLAQARQVGMGHSWGLAAVTSSEVGGAHYDQVHSLAGAGMPSAWAARSDTTYYHWAYTDVLSMAQETGAVWNGNIPADVPAFTSRVYEREGDFTLYLPGPSSPTGMPVSPPPSMPASTNAFDNHSLIASDRLENQAVLDDIVYAIGSGSAE